MAAGGLWPAGLQFECGPGSVFLCAILSLGPAAALGPPPSRLFPWQGLGKPPAAVPRVSSRALL